MFKNKLDFTHEFLRNIIRWFNKNAKCSQWTSATTSAKSTVYANKRSHIANRSLGTEAVAFQCTFGTYALMLGNKNYYIWSARHLCLYNFTNTKWHECVRCSYVQHAIPAIVWYVSIQAIARLQHRCSLHMNFKRISFLDDNDSIVLSFQFAWRKIDAH